MGQSPSSRPRSQVQHEPKKTMMFDGIREDLDKVPVRVDIVNVDGLDRTKDDYVDRHLRDIFEAKNFAELVSKIAIAQKKLGHLGCFRSVGTMIDTNKNAGASPDGYTVNFNVNEIGRFVGSINTMVGANDGSIVFALKAPNVLGRGERVHFEHTIGSSSSKGTTFFVTKPLQGPWNAEVTGSLFNQKLPNILSGYNISSTGGLLDLAFESAQRVRHNMQWEGNWRELETHSRSTSFAVRQQTGHSFKSAIRHILTVDHRDRHIFPNTGVYLKLLQEFAGLSGDVGFMKHDSELQVNVPLPSDMVLQGGLRFGVIHPLDNRDQSHNIHDLFFLGGPSGPQILRGFEMKSIGARSGKDCLGGQAYWSSAVHLYTPLPFDLGRDSFGDYFRTHFFINAGNITQETFNSEDFADGFQLLVKNFRASCGIGLAMRLGNFARVELNYCWPLKFTKGDLVVRGVQFGLGVEFL